MFKTCFYLRHESCDLLICLVWKLRPHSSLLWFLENIKYSQSPEWKVQARALRTKKNEVMLSICGRTLREIEICHSEIVCFDVRFILSWSELEAAERILWPSRLHLTQGHMLPFLKEHESPLPRCPYLLYQEKDQVLIRVMNQTTWSLSTVYFVHSYKLLLLETEHPPFRCLIASLQCIVPLSKCYAHESKYLWVLYQKWHGMENFNPHSCKPLLPQENLWPSGLTFSALLSGLGRTKKRKTNSTCPACSAVSLGFS